MSVKMIKEKRNTYWSTKYASIKTTDKAKHQEIFRKYKLHKLCNWDLM